jgi:hypothetical protein
MFAGDLSLLNGGEGYVAWGYRTAARCTSWTVQRSLGYWTLRAKVSSVDLFQLQQQPLEFRTPRKGGFLCFPVTSVQLVDKQLSATLGPPIA